MQRVGRGQDRVYRSRTKANRWMYSSPECKRHSFEGVCELLLSVVAIAVATITTSVVIILPLI